MRKPADYISSPFRSIYGYDRAYPEDEGCIAFEFEWEGRGLGEVDPGRNWRNIRDDSLRNGGRKFISAQPFSREGWKRSLRYLQKQVAKTATINLSDRCSVHVHLNFQERSPKEAIQFAVLWYCLEEYLCEYSGEDRAGNLFCLRLQDCSEAYEPLIGLARGHARFTNNLRYLALNPYSLSRFGSIEIRSFRGVKNTEEVIPWAECLLEMYDVSKDEFNSPEHLVQEISSQAPVPFLKRYLPKTYQTIFSGLEDYEIERSVMEGLRNCQDLAYCVRWEDRKTRKKPSTL